MKASRIIVSRTDNVGDVVLALPMVGILREHLPSSDILFLGRSYTRAVIESCEHVDGFLNWDDVSTQDGEVQAAFLREQDADVIIHVFPHQAIAAAARRARIPSRIGSARRGHHLLNCNRRVNFTRRKSDLHEAQLNVKLLQPLGFKNVPSLAELTSYYGLTKLQPLREDLAAHLAAERLNLIIHPKTKGNAREWSLENFSRLMTSLPEDRYRIFVTGTEDELSVIGGQLPMDRPNVTSLLGQLNLGDLIAFISRADALLANSTGPLHLAAALGIHTIGLYAPMRPRHPGRWSPVGTHAHALVFDPSCERCRKRLDCNCIQDIQPSAIQGILEPLADHLGDLVGSRGGALT